MRGIFPGCCACAASGHAAAPPSSVMKSRRFTCRMSPVLSNRKDSTPRLRQETAARGGRRPEQVRFLEPDGMARSACSSHHWSEDPMEGGCTCRQIRYRLTGTPLIVHACHCRWCQRETGTAHALNALYEADRVVHTAGEPEIIETPSASGRGQKIARCPTCKVAIWSNYPQAGPAVRFVRVGTLDDPDRCPPDIHIFTSSKQPWVTLPPGAKAVPEFYDLAAVWPPESLERRRIMREGLRGQS